MVRGGHGLGMEVEDEESRPVSGRESGRAIDWTVLSLRIELMLLVQGSLIFGKKHSTLPPPPAAAAFAEARVEKRNLNFETARRLQRLLIVRSPTSKPFIHG